MDEEGKKRGKGCTKAFDVELCDELNKFPTLVGDLTSYSIEDVL